MKKSELRKLISEYNRLKLQIKKKYVHQDKILEKMKDIEHRYFHETGNLITAL